MIQKKITSTRKLQYLRNAWKFLHQIFLVCLGRNFMLYLLHLRQHSVITNFKNEFRNWRKSWFYKTNPSDGTSLWNNIDKSFTSNCFTVYFKTLKLGCRHLVVFAALLYGIRTRTVVELLTELCVLPVVDGLTGRRWTTMIARWHTVDSWYDGSSSSWWPDREEMDNHDCTLTHSGLLIWRFFQ